MTDKERLERIKQDDLLRIINDISLYGPEGIRMELVIEDIEWLIQQAERAQKNAQDLEDMDRQLYSEQQQNKRYREAMVSALSEIEYALYSQKSLKVKEHYLKNAKRYINQALESDEN